MIQFQRTHSRSLGFCRNSECGKIVAVAIFRNKHRYEFIALGAFAAMHNANNRHSSDNDFYENKM